MSAYESAGLTEALRGEKEKCSLLVEDQITQKGLGLLGLGLYLNSQKMDISQQPPYSK